MTNFSMKHSKKNIFFRISFNNANVFIIVSIYICVFELHERKWNLFSTIDPVRETLPTIGNCIIT